MLSCVLPLNEILVDFNDKLKIHDPRLRLDGLRTRRLPRRENGQDGHAHRRRSGRGLLHHRPPRQGRSPAAALLAGKLKEVIPSQLFVVAIQAAIGGKIVARESHLAPCARTSPPNATAATSRRKRKLLEKQKEGKKKMKMFGKVNIPQDAFIKVLKSGD